MIDMLTTLPPQTKSGYKTRRKHNVNNWVVKPRPRNFGKRRSKSGA